MDRRFGTGFVVGVVLTAIGLAATAAVAGTGIGGVFNLGKVNMVDRGSTLSGSAPKLLIVKNTGTGPAAVGIAITVPAGKPPLQVNSTARVANLNADLLDGESASDFVNGKGVLQQQQVNVPFNTGTPAELLVSGGFFLVSYDCPVGGNDSGTFHLQNLSSALMDMFIEQDGSNLQYTVIAGGSTFDRPASHFGDRIHYQVAVPGVGVADITVFSVHRDVDCHLQALATVALAP
jgi:hypothetical protein